MKDFQAALGAVEKAIANLPSELAHHRNLSLQSIERLFKKAATKTDAGIFISTGDIDAMWLRDSSFQVRPLIRFCDNSDVREFVQGVIAQQAFYIAIDPYANAFNVGPNANHWHKDFDSQSDWVFERKWEIDSLASFLDISLLLAERCHDSSHLDANWWRAAELVVSTFETELNHDPEGYRLLRPGAPDHDHLSNNGFGEPFAPCGLIWSAFRPSDDACELPFNIAQNAYAVAALERLATFAEPALAIRASSLARTINSSISENAVDGEIYAYEIDGLGRQVFLDDANIPSLLSLPYLGFCEPDSSNYLATRSFVLSSRNPWFFSGSAVSHIGSPHTGHGRVWPLAMAMEIITSQNLELKKLDFLQDVALAGKGFHESIDVNDATNFTREWFSWAEMTYFDAVFSTAEVLQRPGLAI